MKAISNDEAGIFRLEGELAPDAYLDMDTGELSNIKTKNSVGFISSVPWAEEHPMTEKGYRPKKLLSIEGHEFVDGSSDHYARCEFEDFHNSINGNNKGMFDVAVWDENSEVCLILSREDKEEIKRYREENNLM